MAKKNEKLGASETTNEPDNFLPGGEWVEISQTGAPIYKPEAGVAEGKPLQGIAYDTILALGGSSNCGVWEAIIVRTTLPTIAFKDGEQVEVPAGEDVLIAANALLGDVVRASRHGSRVRHVKIQPIEEKEHSKIKGRSYWVYRIGLGPFVDRTAEGLFMLPERADIFEKLAEFEKGLKDKTVDNDPGSAVILQSYRRRLQEMAAVTGNSAPQLHA